MELRQPCNNNSFIYKKTDLENMHAMYDGDLQQNSVSLQCGIIFTKDKGVIIKQFMTFDYFSILNFSHMY